MKELYKFSKMMVFILAFRAIFGDANTLVGVGVYVCIATLSACSIGIDKFGVIFTTFFAFVVGAYVAHSGNLILIAGYIFILTKLSGGLNIIYTLPFIFMHSIPGDLGLRLIATVIGSILICIKAKSGETSLREFFKSTDTGFAIRMSIGIVIGISISNIMNFPRPMWITLVILSLTQIEAEETHTRIKHRLIGTVIGLCIALLIPGKYSFAAVLFIGYLGFFITDYRSKQIFNCVAAFFASLAILGVGGVVINRILGLLIGIGVALTTKFLRIKKEGTC